MNMTLFGLPNLMTNIRKKRDEGLTVFNKYGAVPFAVGDIRTKDEIEESAIWQQLTENEILKLNSTISQIRFSPVEPHSVLALSGLSGAWIDGKTHRHVYSFAKAKTPFTAAAFRKDGILVALGREDGAVDVYPVSNHQTLLRRYKLNSGVIFGVSFSPFANELVVGSGNGSLFIIQIASRTEFKSFQAHDDAISDVLPLESGNIWVSSSHDCKIKIWDFNTQETLSQVETSHPVTHMVVKGNRAFASCGESVVVVDLKSNASIISSFTPHTRPIVGISIARSNIVTASADRTIKVFDSSTFALLHTIKLHSNITSFDVMPDASSIAIALAEGILQLKYKVIPPKPDNNLMNSEEIGNIMMPANFRVFSQYPSQTNTENIQYKNKKWNIELKKFNFKDALDLVLKEDDPPLIVGMIDELDRLGYLDQAISGRTKDTLKPILNFLVNNAVNPIWSHVVLKAVISVETIYRSVILDDPEIGDIFDRLTRVIRDELQVQLRVSRLVGKIDVILNKPE